MSTCEYYKKNNLIKSVKSFLLKNTINKHNQHACKLFRAGLKTKSHTQMKVLDNIEQERMSSPALRGHLVSMETLITEDKSLPLKSILQHDSFDLRFFKKWVIEFFLKSSFGHLKFGSNWVYVVSKIFWTPLGGIELPHCVMESLFSCKSVLHTNDFSSLKE